MGYVSAAGRAFVFVIDSTLDSDGNNNQLTIPAGAFGPFNYDVSWTDSGSNTGSATGQTGSYTFTVPTAGPVTITITGDFPSFGNNVSDCMSGKKYGITDVVQWGSKVWQTLSTSFCNEPSPALAPQTHQTLATPA
ncbi:MAG: hypothetical protein LRY39_00625 [Alphaproteobacteria bacterium]|nr:hypothetical protein [Alphaproteobacteria bacterium]